MLSIAVCDDEIIECCNMARKIKDILEEMGRPCIVRQFQSGGELLQALESFDIVFLDIKMPEISGMELAKEMRKQGRLSLIIFITSASEYVFDAFDVEAFQYLLKPIQTDKLKNVLEKATKRIQIDDNTDFLIISANRQIQKVFLKDILYIESIGRIAIIHCNGGTLEAYEQIGVLEDKLSDKSFFRCHKCFLVNLNYVDAFNKTEVQLENGEKIMLAKRRYEDFQKRILSHMKIKGGIM